MVGFGVSPSQGLYKKVGFTSAELPPEPISGPLPIPKKPFWPSKIFSESLLYTSTRDTFPQSSFKNHPFIMLRQALSGPSRALGSNLRSAAQRPLLRTPFRQAPILPVTRAVQPSAARWYSAETESGKEPAKDGAESKAPAGEQAKETPEEALKKQLEAKDAELRDWKVCLSPLPPALSLPSTEIARNSLARHPRPQANLALSPTSRTSISAP